MKILLYGLNYAPEPTGIGKYNGEMAAWLSEAGHEVRVIAAQPYYPAWKVAPEHRGWRSVVERVAGVQVTRTPLWVPANPSGLKRIVHLLSFAVCSLPALVRHMFWKPHVVVTVAPAFACAPGGWAAARLCGAKAWLHIQDFEIDAAFQMGLLRGRSASVAIGWLERCILRRFDRVSTISGRMLRLLRSKGVSDSRAVHFPNWVDINAISPARTDRSYRAELKIPAGAVVALYSGSMAGKQGLELLPIVARAVEKSLPQLVFVLCGDGVCKAGLERDCAGLSNVRMLPLQPTHRLGELLSMADIHMLPQSSAAADLVMPSKLTGMLASGRPVLATAMPGTELADVVSQVGRVVPPHDAEAFIGALTALLNSATLRAELGAAARLYAEQYLAREGVMSDFDQALRRCVGTMPRPKIDALGGPLPPTVEKPRETT